MVFGNNMQDPGYFQQGGYAPYGGPVPVYGQPQQSIRKNTLSDAEIDMLQQNNNEFNMGLTETEVLKAKCNHRQKGGLQDSLVELPDGSCQCTICGYKFKPIDAGVDREKLQTAVDDVIDIAQTIKLLFVDLPEPAGSEFMQIIPLMSKLPKIFDMAVKNYAKHDTNPYGNIGNRNLGTAALFQAITGYMNQPYQNYQQTVQQPYMDPTMGATAYQQPQPQYYNAAPQYGYPSNGFGAPGLYQPQTAGYQYVPNGQPAPVAPQVAPAQPQATVTAAPTADASATVDANFKSGK